MRVAGGAGRVDRNQVMGHTLNLVQTYKFSVHHVYVVYKHLKRLHTHFYSQRLVHF